MTGEDMTDNVAAAVRLMLVTDDRIVAGRELVAACVAAERGGATCVQLRLKLATPREQLELARTLRASLRVPLLVNDRPDVALAAGAAGVHLGPDDLPVPLARRLLPRPMIVGASVGGEAEVPAGADADYWGIGPWRTTATKADAGAAIGADGFAALVRRAEGRPCIAIGGIRPEDGAAVLAAGGAGIAVVSGILGAEDVEAATRRYLAAL